MKKIRSLLYRELRITGRRYLLTELIPLAYFVLGCIGLYFSKREMSAEEDPEIIIRALTTTVSLMVPAIAMVVSCVNTVHNSDIKSGWLRYSYSLPVNASERALAVLIRFYVQIAASAVFGIAAVCVLHAVGGVKFQVSYAALMAVEADLLLIMQIINNIFVYRSRTVEEFKKNTNYGGLSSALVIGCIVFALLKISGFDFSAVTDNQNGAVPVNIEFLSMINGKILLWAVPLMPVLSVCYYLSLKTALQNSFGTAAVSPKAKTALKDGKDDLDIAAPHSEPVGYLYKELLQNKAAALAVMGMPFLAIVFMAFVYTVYCLTGQSGAGISALPEMLTSTASRLIMTALGYFASGMLMSGIASGDHKKLGSYYIISLPDGPRNLMYTKYVLCFAMCGIYFASSYFADNLIMTLRWFTVGEEAASFTVIYICIFFFMLFENSLRIPLTVRFGEKKGGTVSILMILCLGIAAVILLSVMPDDAMRAAAACIMKFLESGSVDDIAALVMGIAPFVCTGAYILSCRLSLKLFRKGVEEYDR